MNFIRFGLKRALFGVVAALIAVAPLSAQALDEAAARAQVTAVFGRLSAIVDAGGGEATVRDAFHTVLSEEVAYRDVARLSIGVLWRSMSDGQKDEFVAAVLDYMARSYSSSFESFKGGDLVVGEMVDSNDREVLIDSQFTYADQNRQVRVIWRVIEQRDGSVKVLDLYIEGVSLLRTQQDEFESMLEQNGDDIDALTAQIAN